jgi:hypothetical protein
MARTYACRNVRIKLINVANGVAGWLVVNFHYVIAIESVDNTLRNCDCVGGQYLENSETAIVLLDQCRSFTSEIGSIHPMCLSNNLRGTAPLTPTFE